MLVGSNNRLTFREHYLLPYVIALCNFIYLSWCVIMFTNSGKEHTTYNVFFTWIRTFSFYGIIIWNDKVYKNCDKLNLYMVVRWLSNVYRRCQLYVRKLIKLTSWTSFHNRLNNCGLIFAKISRHCAFQMKWSKKYLILYPPCNCK